MRLFTKENMARLEPHERRRLMEIQMAPHGGRRSYLPDDCSECDGCGEPMLGSGLCNHCYSEWSALTAKALGTETSILGVAR